MNFIKEYSGVVALVILAILAVTGGFSAGKAGVFGSTSCADTTCLTGGLRLLGTGYLETAGNFSVATTSNTRMINAGAGGSATTTIDVGKPCFQTTVNAGGVTSVVYYWPSNVGALGGWATSSTACF